MKDKSKIKIDRKKIIIFISIIVCILFLVVIVRNDDMKNAGIYNISYRTRTSKNNYTKWVRNGSSTEKLDSINKIEFNVSKKESGTVVYSISGKDKKWSDYVKISENMKSTTIYGLKLNLTKILYKKYDICYRTYNSKNKWMEWSCNGSENGNSKYPIQKIEIKIIPKNVILNEYLKDYNKKYNKKSAIGF